MFLRLQSISPLSESHIVKCIHYFPTNVSLIFFKCYLFSLNLCLIFSLDVSVIPYFFQIDNYFFFKSITYFSKSISYFLPINPFFSKILIHDIFLSPNFPSMCCRWSSMCPCHGHVHHGIHLHRYLH